MPISKNNIIQAFNCKKIRLYSESEKKSESSVLINYLLALLGISMIEGDGKELHYIVLEEFVNETLVDYSYEEIKLAFRNLIKGDYPGIQVYNKLDSVLVGKVMKAFDNQRSYAIQQDRIKKQKEKLKEDIITLTDSEEKELFINAVKDEFESFKKKGEVNPMRNWLYDKLLEFNLKVDDDYKLIAWKHSVKEIREEQDNLLKRNKYDKETLKSKSTILYKSKLIEIIFKKFRTAEQLLNKINNNKTL